MNEILTGLTAYIDLVETMQRCTDAHEARRISKVAGLALTTLKAQVHSFRKHQSAINAGAVTNAKGLLVHYFRLAGVARDSDNVAEIEQIVDSILEAAKGGAA